MAHRDPPGSPGRLLGLSNIRRFKADSLEFITDLGREFGDIAHFRLGPIRAYLVNNPELIREVLVTKARHFRKQPRTLNALRQIDGNGLIVSEGDFWLQQRRLVQPAFHPRRFTRYAELSVEYTRRMLADWQSGAVIDIADAMTRLTLAIIARTLFDVELSGQASQLGEAVHVLSETMVRELSSLFALPDWIPTESKRRKRWAISTLRMMIEEIIRERRAKQEDRGDLLSMLLLATDAEGDGRRMTDRQAADEAMTLFNAGHDSTAAALAWIWYLIASHPEVEAKLVEEAHGTLGSRSATYEDVARLAYTERVVKEALRLYPPTWAMLPREVITPVELGGYLLPRGGNVYIFPWVTHRDSRFFPDPLAFDPDRFAPGRVEQIPQYAWIPFGGGPHICIGNTFALMEMTLIVATVLREFRLMLPPDQAASVPEPLVAIRPRGGLRMQLERRPTPVTVP